MARNQEQKIRYTKEERHQISMRAKENGNLRDLERKFGESYSSWNRNQIETQEATRLGLTLQAFRDIDDERRIKGKDTARKTMFKKMQCRIDALRRITDAMKSYSPPPY